MAKLTKPQQWRSRIVGQGEEAPDQLLANPLNFRIHPKAQQQAMSGILDEVGWVDTVLVNQTTGYVVNGHLRIELAISRGEPTVPVTYVELTEAEERLVLATFDPISALAGAGKEVLDALLRDVRSGDAAVQELLAKTAKAAGLSYLQDTVEAPEPQMDRAAELQEQWGTERGQLWKIPSLATPSKSHRLLCGDSTSEADVARLMGGEKAEVVWTDPPYGVAIGDKNKRLNAIAPSNRVEANLTGDTLDEQGLGEMLDAAFDGATQHCEPGAAWYVAAPAGPLHGLFALLLKKRGIWHQTILWVKNNATLAPMGVDYHWRAEPIFYGWLPNAGHRYYGGRTQDTVWNVDRPAKSPEHPTMKPVELIARAIQNSSLAGQAILDPFLGSGSTMCAAEQLGRLCYGMEIEPKYVAVALQRLADMGLEPRRAD